MRLLSVEGLYVREASGQSNKSNAIILWLGMVMMQLQIFDFTPFVSKLMQDFAVSYTQIGLIQTALFLPYAAVQLIAGAVVGRYRTKRTLIVAAAAFSVSSILVAFAQSFYQVIALRAIMGTSIAFIFVLSSKVILGSSSRGSRGTSFGGYASAFALGPLMAALAPTGFGSLAGSWRLMVLALGLAGLLSVFLFLFLVTPERTSTGAPSSITSILKRSETWVLEYDQFLRFGTAAALATWIPTLAGQLFQLTPAESGFLLASVWVMSFVFTPVGGLLSDMRGRNFFVIEIVLIGLTPSLVGIGLVSSYVGLWVTALAAGALMNLHVAPLFKILPDVYGDEKIALVTGLSGAAASAGAMAIPPLLGLVKDITGEFMLGWLVLSAMTFLAAIITITLRRF